LRGYWYRRLDEETGRPITTKPPIAFTFYAHTSSALTTTPDTDSNTV
jgi:hypothetical protein